MKFLLWVPQKEIIYNGAFREQMEKVNNARRTGKYFSRGQFILNREVHGKLKDQRKRD
jgi:hypothetical protein